jgi:streptogramin lyase
MQPVVVLFTAAVLVFLMKTKRRQLAGAVSAIWIIAASGYAQTYAFRNVAGNTTNIYGGSTDGANGNAQFSFPAGVTTDSQGNVYVADQLNCTIRKVAPAGTNWVVSTIAGSPGVFDLQDGTNARAFFNFPAGIAVDPSGNLFVADTGNNAIRKVTPLAGTTNWVVTTIAGKGQRYPGFADGTNSNALFNGPAGIAVDANGNVLVADQYNNSIRKITPVAGTANWIVTTIAGQGPDTNGVADGTNAAAQFSYPAGVAVDTNGNLFVADQANNEIRKMTSLGTNWIVTTIAGHNSIKSGSAGFVDGTNTVAQFNGPAGVAVDASDNVYVADQTNNAIRKLTPLGANWVTTTIGGQPRSAGTNNGAGTNALFNSPLGLAVDGKGGVFVADTENNTIRIGFLPPAILTAAPPLGFSQGQFGFNLTGPTGQLVLVESSTDLLAWLPIWTNVFGPGLLSFTGPQAAAPSPRFYRVHLP